MPIYTGVNNKAREVSDIYVGVGSKAKKVSKIYVGDTNNIARLCYEANNEVIDGYVITWDTNTIEGIRKNGNSYNTGTIVTNGSIIPANTQLWIKTKRTLTVGGGGSIISTQAIVTPIETNYIITVFETNTDTNKQTRIAAENTTGITITVSHTMPQYSCYFSSTTVESTGGGGSIM